jgi:hypothetical protein
MARLPLVAAATLLFRLANAAPQPLVTQAPRQVDVGQLDPWITVGTDGTHTITPVLTTLSGTPTIISPAPAEEVTKTVGGTITTSSAPFPTATETQGTGGAFPVCQNKDGPFAPFCNPTNGTTLNPGVTYYGKLLPEIMVALQHANLNLIVTWDPTFFPTSNITLNILATYPNTTQSAWNKMYAQSGLGFAIMAVDDTMKLNGKASNVTFSIVMPGSGGSTAPQILGGPTVTIADKPGPTPPPQAQAPHGQALYIGIPAAFGALLLIVFGTCLWNRKARKIDLGNIMSRSRHGYGAGKNRTERVLGRRGKKEGAIRLQERELNVPDEQRYHDAPRPAGQEQHPTGLASWDAGWQEQVPGRTRDGAHGGVARRDSDVLGSLAGTPTEERHMDFGRHETGNAFRDELSRQDRERL